MRDHFAWEYKGKHKDLHKAYLQLADYREDLGNPPLLVVCDLDRFQVHTNFTSTTKRIYSFSLDDLNRNVVTATCPLPPLDVLRALFDDYNVLRPERTAARVTEDAARKFLRLAERLELEPRAEKPGKEQIAHFLMRIVFCLFADSIGLLPEHVFRDLIRHHRTRPRKFRKSSPIWPTGLTDQQILEYLLTVNHERFAVSQTEFCCPGYLLCSLPLLNPLRTSTVRRMVPDFKVDDAAVLTLTFKGGLADRNRLPLDQVTRTLIEFQDMARELGAQVQRQHGHTQCDGDFGFELLTSGSGLVFRKGSVKAQIVATRDLINAKRTLTLIVDNVRQFEKATPVRPEPDQAIVARRMYKIAALQVPAKNTLGVQFKTRELPAHSAMLTERGFAHLAEARRPNVRIENQMLYGRLRALNDRRQVEAEDQHFWGELLLDNGTIWRLRLPSDMLARALPLFRQQVFVQGTAIHFDAKSPRLNVTHVIGDPQRDYLAAFDNLKNSKTPVFGDATVEELIGELYA